MRGLEIDEWPDGSDGRTGQGHSNFCPLECEIDAEKDEVVVGVVFIDAERLIPELVKPDLNMISESPMALISNELRMLGNKSVNRILWKIERVSQWSSQLPCGKALWSKPVSVAGMRDVQL